jgi:DNA mismatch repair protein MutS2
MTPHAAERLEWPRLAEQIAGYAETEMGADRVRALAPLADETAVRDAQALFRAADAADVIRRLSVRGAVDVGDMVERAAKGGSLSAGELYAVRATLERAAAMEDAVRQADDPVLTRHFGQVPVPRWLAQALADVVDEDGAVLDRASSELAAIRREIRRVIAEIDQIFERLLRTPAVLAVLQEPVVMLRAGRRVLPVKVQERARLPGLVHDQSGSGQTVFVEPLAAVEAHNRLKRLEAAERDEIARILAHWSAEIGRHADPIRQLSEALGRLDALLASVRWADAVGAMLPAIGGDRLILVEARHPLLEHPVPVSLTVGGPSPVLVITGPNTGGKTVVLKVAGLMVWLALSGLPVPAASGTTVPVFQAVWVDIGDEQSLDQSLSTFSGHLKNLVPMVAGARPGVLVLVDEIGAGTDPDEGAALAVALIERWRDAGATVIVTTHFARVKLLAFRDPRVRNARVEFDRERLVPTYRLVMDQPGSSHALYIAERLGLDPDVVARARALLGAEEARVEGVLATLNALEQQVREREATLAAEWARLTAEARQVKAERERLERERREDRQRDREIFRETLTAFKREAAAAIQAVRAAEREEREAALRRLRETLGAFEAAAPPAPEEALPATHGRTWQLGDWVASTRLPAPGQIVALDREAAVIGVGSLKLRVPVATLTPAAPPRAATSAARAGLTRAPAWSCDLRGLTVDEALDTLDRYLDGAVAAGLPSVRIIHGKGTGALRRAVQEFLRAYPPARSFRLGEPGEGGDGVTIVELGDGSG